ncbi:MAG: capsid cement protein [Verrucomicrobiota bacterium]
MNKITALIAFVCLGTLDFFRTLAGGVAIQANAVVPGTVGQSPGCITRSAEVALASEHLLLKPGTAANEVDICGANDLPIGWNDDEAVIDTNTNVNLLGSAFETAVLTASGNVAIGDPVYTAAAGRVSTLSAIAGTYYQVGVALSAAADGEEVEVDPCLARKEVVV